MKKSLSLKKRKEAIDYLVDLMNIYNDYEEISNSLFNLYDNKIISNEQYKFLQNNYDLILKLYFE